MSLNAERTTGDGDEEMDVEQDAEVPRDLTGTLGGVTNPLQVQGGGPGTSSDAVAAVDAARFELMVSTLRTLGLEEAAWCQQT